MSSQLHQAVERAQAGQRDEARRLLWQYLQTDPDNTVAWLWLASVAADQPEYVRALNEVLRIDPTHVRARQLLDEFQQRYGSVGGASTPPFAQPSAGAGSYAPPPGQAAGQAPPQAQVSPPPPPPTPSYQPPAQGAPAYQPPPQSYMQDAYQYEPESAPRKPKARDSEPEIVRERVIERRGGRGCGCLPMVTPGCGCLGCGGCGQSCLITLVLLIVLPLMVLGALSFGDFSVGPLDFPMSYLPDRFGMKSITFESGEYEISFDAPRSWYLVSGQNDMWLLWRDVLAEAASFDADGRSWEDFEEIADPVIMETDPIRLNMSGDVIMLQLTGEVSGDFTCDDTISLPDDMLTRYADGLCGTTMSVTDPYAGGPAFRNSTAPVEWITYTFTVPVDSGTALEWQVGVPEDMHGFYEPRINTVIESAQIKQK